MTEPNSSNYSQGFVPIDEEGVAEKSRDQTLDDSGKHSSDRETCAVLCSLMTASGHPETRQCASPTESDHGIYECKPNSLKSCPKQMQLPMFLSSTYT
jgi:hypothetical protein